MIDASCAVCDGPALEPALTTLVQCQTCQHVQFFCDPSEAASLYTAEYFNGAEYVDYLAQESALRRSMRRRLAQMANFGPLRGALVEVGCAYGLFVDEARRFFQSVVGVDICEEPLAEARRRFQLDVRYGDFTTLELPEQSFDVVCMWDTIEHLPNPADFLRSAYRVLKPGGRLYLTTGDIGAFNARLRGHDWRQIHPPSHLQYFSRPTMRRVLEKCGFATLQIETAAYYHTLFNILATFRLRGGLSGRVAGGLLSLLGETASMRIGGWVNLGDTMFVAAERR